MAMVVPSTSYAAAMPRCKVSVRKGLRCSAFVAGERASFASGETRLRTRLENRKRRTTGSRKGVVVMAADYYSTLGVARNATKSDIKSAYRKLARKVSIPG